VPELGPVFKDGMTSMPTMETPLVVAAYGFSDFDSVVDGASAVLAAAGVSDRCETVGGSFFESIPTGVTCAPR
jgi:hypothetical protein